MTTRTFWAGVCCSVWICGSLQAQSTTLSNSDKQFLKMAADANMTEAHLGQMAEAQASDDAVKSFGKTLDQDHTKAYGQLAEIASKTGQAIPKGIDVGRDKAIERLMNMKGKSFDLSFARHEVQDHQRTIAAFQREAKQGENPDLKVYAQQSLPILEKHLHSAQMLVKSENPS